MNRMNRTKRWSTASVVWVSTMIASGSASAATLQVGPDKPYTTVADAVAAAQSGDVIEVDAGEYVDDWASISVEDLTIVGVGDTPAHLRNTVDIPNSKGILVVNPGGGLRVENLEFSGAFVDEADGANGAGIRMQGAWLEVAGCYFHDNQNGILSGGDEGYTVTIENSEFAYNGNPGSGFEHNVYVSGDAASLHFVGNYTHHAYSGHTLKSRADENYVLYNRLMDEADGSSSYLIDLPEGGLSYVIGNAIQQGPEAENRGTIVNYKGEGGTNPLLRLYFVHNTVVNEADNPNTIFVRIHEAESAVVRNNLFVGMGTPISDESGAADVTDEGNVVSDDPGLVDMAGYDYKLLESSVAVDAGVEPGEGDGFDLTPTDHYVHPAMTEARPMVGSFDVGAYEWGEAPGGTGTSGGDDSSTSDGGGDTGAGDTGVGDEGADTVDDGTSAPTSDGSTGGDTDGDTDGAGSAGDEGGCGCRSTSPMYATGWLPLLVLLGSRRRRL